MNSPDHLKYANTHEWVKVDEQGLVITGISDHAQDALGDIVYVELPTVGTHLTATHTAGVVESVKTASDIHAPVSGVVVEVNTALEDDPEIINQDPYGQGWIYKIKPDQLDEDLNTLLNHAAYQATL